MFCFRPLRVVSAYVVFGLTLSAFAQPSPPDDDDGDWPGAAIAWFYNQRTYPSGKIPLGARLKALEEIQRLDRAARTNRPPSTAGLDEKLAAAVDSARWTLLGPRPTFDLAPGEIYSGRIAALALDPRDNSTAYLGTATGGVWKTSDGGANWSPIGDDQPSLAIGAIALDPKNPDIVYAGTGEENFSNDGYYGVGILKSTNGGASWTTIQGPFLHGHIGGLAIHPVNTSMILCSALNGLYRSTDSGATWTLVLSGEATSVLFDPTNGNIAYAAIGAVHGGATNGVYRSTDAGQTWRAIDGSGTSALPTSPAGRISLALSPSTPTTIFAAIADGGTNHFLDVYRSTDSGYTWNALNAPEICPKGQCGYDMAIAVHPKNANVIYIAGDVVIARTLNGGATWSQLVDPATFQGPNGIRVHVDEHVLLFNSDGSKLYLGNDGGIFMTTDILVSQIEQVNWTELNDTLAITQIYPGMSIHPSSATRALIGAQDNRTQLYTGAANWKSVTCGDGGYTAFDPAVPTIAFATCTSKDPFPTVLRSTDSGVTWHGSEYGIDASERADFMPPFVIDPSNAQVVYYGTYRLYQSRDSGGKFTAVSGDLTAGSSDAITTIAVAPSDSKTVYVGASIAVPEAPTAVTSPRIHVATNALDALPLWNDRSNGLPRRVITRIVIDPLDPSAAYATFAGFFSGGSDIPGHVFKTSNAGGNWSNASGNLPDIPVNDLVIDPDLPNTLYVATDLGVMVSRDGGGTWTSLGSGLPHVVVDSLVLHRPSRILRAGTYGRSVWDILVPLSSSSVQPTLTALNPQTVNAGGGQFTLQVTGTNLVAGTALRWNGSNRPTSIVDSSHIVATISASDIAHVGRVAVDVFNPSRGAGVSNALNLTIGPAPASSSDAFVNAAFPTGGSALAPGSIASIYGTNLTGATIVADQAPPLPGTLGETTLTLAGATVPLFFVSPNQINFQVPYFTTLTGPSAQTLTITQGSLTTSVRVTVKPFAPGVFTTNAQGTGQAAALIAGTASIPAPVGTFSGSRPAKRGEFVSVFCTGLGDLANRPTIGQPAPTNPLATTRTNPTVTVGGINAPVSFSGLAPGFVGLYQVNIQIPDNAPTGNAVATMLSIGGVSANPVTIAVQ